MISLPPIVRYFVLCNDLVADPNNANNVSLVNLIHSMRSTATPPFPFAADPFCAFAALANCRGKGTFDLWVVEAESTSRIHRLSPKEVDFGVNPLHVYGLPIRIGHCVFPSSGLYWVELSYNGEVIAQQNLLVE